MWLVTLIVFILILGVIVLVHELGHFLWAKKFGVFIHEFSIGMGPVIYSKKGKDNILYNVRALPIGGFVSMAGEVYEDDDTVPKEKCLCNKPAWQRIIVMAAGVVNNFLMAIVLLFVMALIWGSTTLDARVSDVKAGYPMAEAGIVKGDLIVGINGYKVNTWDEAQIVLYYENDNDYYEFEIEHVDGKRETYKITPVKEKDEAGNETTVFGVHVNQEETFGLWNKIKYAVVKFGTTIKTMWLTIAGLITGKISIDALSGPVGIYTVVGESINYGLYSVLFLVAYLSINVGVINIIPFPAFDGGRILFILIEKIKGSPVNQKFENWCHTIGFALLMLLILFITIKDIIKLF